MKMLLSLWAYMRARALERSTWVGFGAAGGGVLTTAGQYLTTVEIHWIARVIALAGFLAVLVPTSKATEDKCDAGTS